MIVSFITNILTATVVAGTPLLFGTLGGILNEKSGISNLGYEGMMMVGAVVAYMTVQATGSLLLATVAGMAAGALMALIHAFICITLKSNQIVSGLALTIFGTGLANFLGAPYVGTVRAVSYANLAIPGLSRIPIIGNALFNQNILVYVSMLLVPLIWIYINRTRWGMNLRAAGENPAAADSVGINVFAIRYVHTLLGGALGGLAGAYFSLAYYGTWMDTITGGQGWIAVALVIFATWNPVRALAGSYLFGLVTILGLRLQAYGVVIPVSFFSMLPYLLTVVVLILVTGNFKRPRKGVAQPAALSIPYDRETR